MKKQYIIVINMNENIIYKVVQNLIIIFEEHFEKYFNKKHVRILFSRR